MLIYGFPLFAQDKGLLWKIPLSAVTIYSDATWKQFAVFFLQISYILHKKCTLLSNNDEQVFWMSIFIHISCMHANIQMNNHMHIPGYTLY